MALRRTRGLVALAALLVVTTAVPGARAQRRQHLTDANFEDVTQAATGQTTGVW